LETYLPSTLSPPRYLYHKFQLAGFTPLPNIMKKGTGHDKIYMSIDHLKSGKYQLNILLENKVVQTLEIKKEETKRLKK